ncbi:hypothetical protein FRC07_004506 [Ceratobasidium sp. 392]|nr:hypothetical protein FRC07_004506 [Ceratobasidium sp. 392]
MFGLPLPPYAMNMTQQDFFAFARANEWTLQPTPTQPTAAVQPTANVELTVSTQPTTANPLNAPQTTLIQLTAPEHTIVTPAEQPANQPLAPSQPVTQVWSNALPRSAPPPWSAPPPRSAPLTRLNTSTPLNPQTWQAGFVLSTAPVSPSTTPSSFASSTATTQSTPLQSTAPAQPAAPAPQPVAPAPQPVAPVQSTAPARRAVSGPGSLAAARRNHRAAAQSAPQSEGKLDPLLAHRKLNMHELTELCHELTRVLELLDPFDIPYIGSKPKGKRMIAIDVQALLGLTDEGYDCIQEIVKRALQRTPGINMTLTYTQQVSRMLIIRAHKQVMAVMPGFKAYVIHNYWPLDVVAHKVLHVSTGGYQSRARAKENHIAARAAQANPESEVPGEHAELVTQPEVQPTTPSEVPSDPAGASVAPNNIAGPTAPNNPTGPATPNDLAGPADPVAPDSAPAGPTTLTGSAPVNTAENDLMDITRSFRQMAVDPDQSEDEEDAGPFSLPPELSRPNPNQTSSPHGELAPPPALATPLRRSNCQAAAQPNPSSINVSSTVNATSTLRSVSKANSKVTTTVTSAPPAAAQTPTRKPAKQTMSPGLLRQLQAIQSRNLSSTKLAQLPASICAALDAMKNLDMSNIPIDADAMLLASSPVKNDGSVPPPYEADNNGDDSELSDAPQGVRTLESSGEDMDIDNCFGAVAAPRGGNKSGGQGAAKKGAAGGSKKNIRKKL